MKYNICQICQLLSLISVLGLFSCADVWNLPLTEEQAQIVETNSAIKNLLIKLNNYDPKIKDIDKQLDEWTEHTKDLLSIKDEEDKKPTRFDEVRDQVSTVGHTASTALSIVGAGAKVLGYFVPAVGIIGDILAYNNTILETGLQVVDMARPTEIKEKLNTTQEYLLKLKQKSLGLNSEEKAEAKGKFRDLIVALATAQNIVTEIETLNQELLSLYRESLPLKDIDKVVIKTYTKDHIQQLNASLFIFSELCGSVILTGDVIAHSLKRYTTEADIANYLGQWSSLKAFAEGLSARIKEKEKEDELALSEEQN